MCIRVDAVRLWTIYITHYILLLWIRLKPAAKEKVGLSKQRQEKLRTWEKFNDDKNFLERGFIPEIIDKKSFDVYFSFIFFFHTSWEAILTVFTFGDLITSYFEKKFYFRTNCLGIRIFFLEQRANYKYQQFEMNLIVRLL